MSKLRKSGRSGRLLRRVRQGPVKSITVLPSLVTILNGTFGFAAIVFASMPAAAGELTSPFIATAAYLIFCGMLADMLDGQLARMSQNTSSFGGQLDSLCDIITFGVAPAFLMLKVVTHKLDDVNLANESLISRFVWLAALTYVSCAMIRLARFNVENEEASADHKTFVGLPSPSAAGVIASLVLLQEKMLPGSKWVPYLLPFMAIAVAFLMVSRIRYPHVVNYYFKGKKPFSYLLKILMGIGLVILLDPVTALALLFCGFAFWSFATTLYQRALNHRLFRGAASEQSLDPTARPPELAEQSPH
ncbi:MAG: CDP-diacylglycerol--serine O-phosphatidyltransferase [Planctomycetes bacterium]|nr:CDP-diacylglycerol--serine O-phosphatidyltransferase [Planctomycetota bacterium]